MIENNKVILTEQSPLANASEQVGLYKSYFSEEEAHSKKPIFDFIIAFSA